MDDQTIRDFFASINVNTSMLELLHSGIAIFDNKAKLMFANRTYRKMYRLADDKYIGLDAIEFFLTARQGIVEVLRTGKANQCASVSINGLYGVTYRWPLFDNRGEIAGCMTENISVSPFKDKILEVQDIIDELDFGDSYARTFSPKQSTRTVTFSTIVGESAPMRLLKERGRRFAQHDEPILVLGENGSGKDMVAQAIHAASPRCNSNFVAVNCAAIPGELMESELFGYEPGAFTGARSTGKQGLFEIASGGTIFLDEVGEMSLSLQAKLLRVLENHEIQKIGSSTARHVDFRLVSATNRNLEQMVQQGQFREDLYYRLNIFDLVVPPLRERLADIPLLTYSILSELAGPERATTLRVSREVLSLFSTHRWRGNVRELRNVLVYSLYSMKESESELCIRHLPERFFHASDRDFLSSTMMDVDRRTVPNDEEGQTGSADMDLSGEPASAGISSASSNVSMPFTSASSSPFTASTPSASSRKGTLSDSRQEAERRAILDALEKCAGNRLRAARLLGIARSNLYKKMAALNIRD